MYKSVTSSYILSVIFLFPMATLAMSGGSPVQSSEKYPFSVTLTNPILCGGSIISLDPPWILTAAHCIENLVVKGTTEDYSIAYGNKDFSKQSYAAVKKAVLHPLYRTSQQLQSQVYETDRTETVPYDIGLIQLRSPLTPNASVNRIPILMEPASNRNNSKRLETIGMGYTGYEQPHAEVLQYTHCNLTNSDTLHDNNFNNSILLTTSSAGLCHGDSGSPLLSKDGMDEYYLNGILNRILNAYDPDSDNISCPLHDSNFTYFINTFVKPSSHINWIAEVTQLSQSKLTETVLYSNNSNAALWSSTSSAPLLWRGSRLKNDWSILLYIFSLFMYAFI